MALIRLNPVHNPKLPPILAKKEQVGTYINRSVIWSNYFLEIRNVLTNDVCNFVQLHPFVLDDGAVFEKDIDNGVSISIAFRHRCY